MIGKGVVEYSWWSWDKWLLKRRTEHIIMMVTIAIPFKDMMTMTFTLTIR